MDLFERSDPGRYRLVSWGDGTGEDPSLDDPAALVLGLARNLSAEDMIAQLSVLRLDRVTDALIECATEQEFIERMQMA